MGLVRRNVERREDEYLARIGLAASGPAGNSGGRARGLLVRVIKEPSRSPLATQEFTRKYVFQGRQFPSLSLGPIRRLLIQWEVRCWNDQIRELIQDEIDAAQGKSHVVFDPRSERLDDAVHRRIHL